ncbi:hypothetical protein Trydic_g14798 [Trypoxylus dichotomus]
MASEPGDSELPQVKGEDISKEMRYVRIWSGLSGGRHPHGTCRAPRARGRRETRRDNVSGSAAKERRRQIRPLSVLHVIFPLSAEKDPGEDLIITD